MKDAIAANGTVVRGKIISEVDRLDARFIPIEKDVKILNEAPLSFRYHSTRGYLLFSHDELIREEFLCRIWSEYFDFKPVSKIYLKEVAGA